MLYTLDDDARVRSVALDRWGDPESAGTFGLYRFGDEAHPLLELRRRDDSQRRSGPGGSMEPTGGARARLFRYEFTDFRLVTPTSSARP